MFLGGCPCCGKKVCWRCYEADCSEITENRWLGAIPDNYSDAFRLTGYGIDTDARPPDRQNGNSFIAWDGPPFDLATYSVTKQPAIEFYVGNILADNRQRQFGFWVTSCVEVDGENNYYFEFYNLSGDSPELAIVKHVSKDGLETIVNTGNFLSSFYIPMSSESPFLLGQYVAEYADGGTAVIELKDIYQLLQGGESDYQCFDAPPEESGWTPVGDCHPDEPTCQASCPPDTTPLGGRTMPTKTTGPGTQLKNTLAAWGIHAKKGGGCKCKEMEVKMNRWGADCRKHMDAIVDHLQAEAKKRNLPFVRKAGEMLVERAIRRFEKES